MPLKEYLCLFSGVGPIQVTVQFQNKSTSIRKQQMEAQEIAVLIDSQTGDFIKQLTFDDHPYKVEKIELLPHLNKLVIHAYE